MTKQKAERLREDIPWDSNVERVVLVEGQSPKNQCGRFWENDGIFYRKYPDP